MKHFPNFLYPERLPEWISSMVMLLLGVSFLLPGETLSITGYHTLEEIGFTDTSMGLTAVAVGVLRLAALYINGAWERTPAIRMVGAVLSGFIMMAFAIGTAVPFVIGDMPPNTAWGTYLVIALWDLHASYKAGYDARYIHNR
jgi:hypothetical protein